MSCLCCSLHAPRAVPASASVLHASQLSSGRLRARRRPGRGERWACASPYLCNEREIGPVTAPVTTPAGISAGVAAHSLREALESSQGCSKCWHALNPTSLRPCVYLVNTPCNSCTHCSLSLSLGQINRRWVGVLAQLQRRERQRRVALPLTGSCDRTPGNMRTPSKFCCLVGVCCMHTDTHIHCVCVSVCVCGLGGSVM